MTEMEPLGKPYIEEEWAPHGLSCAQCERVLGEGDRYCQRMHAFIDDTPIVIIVCVSCFLGGEPE